MIYSMLCVIKDSFGWLCGTQTLAYRKTPAKTIKQAMDIIDLSPLGDISRASSVEELDAIQNSISEQSLGLDPKFIEALRR